MRFTGSYMELEASILSEVPQEQNDKCHFFSHFWILALSLQMCVSFGIAERSENY